MKSLASWMLTMFMVLFWIFRIVVSITYTFGIELGIEPLNVNFEIILLFITLLCLVLVIKRKLIGGILYFLSMGAYFGMDVYRVVMNIINGESNIMNFTSVVISLIGVALPFAVLMDLIMDKSRMAKPKDKKTDWFYKNKEFDRELDERADKNNYRIN